MDSRVKKFYNYAQAYCKENLAEYSDVIDTTNYYEVFKNREYIDPENSFPIYSTLVDLNSSDIYAQKNTGKLMIKIVLVTGRYFRTSEQYPRTTPITLSKCDDLRAQLAAIDIKYPWEWERNSEIQSKEEIRVRNIKWGIEEKECKILKAKQKIEELQKEIAGLAIDISLEQQKISCKA